MGYGEKTKKFILLFSTSKIKRNLLGLSYILENMYVKIYIL